MISAKQELKEGAPIILFQLMLMVFGVIGTAVEGAYNVGTMVALIMGTGLLISGLYLRQKEVKQ